MTLYRCTTHHTIDLRPGTPKGVYMTLSQPCSGWRTAGTLHYKYVPRSDDSEIWYPSQRAAIKCYIGLLYTLPPANPGQWMWFTFLVGPILLCDATFCCGILHLLPDCHLCWEPVLLGRAGRFVLRMLVKWWHVDCRFSDCRSVE